MKHKAEEIGGVILAGGMSRRMGTNKALIKIGGVRMIDRVYGYLERRVGKIAVNGLKSHWQYENWEIIEDLILSGEGPMIGVWSSLVWARHQELSWVFTLPVDTPFLPEDTLSRLLDETNSALMTCAASHKRHHPVIACWHVSLCEDMEAFIKNGGRKIDHFVGDKTRAIINFADQHGEDAFMNINKPEDVLRAEQIWKQHYA